MTMAMISREVSPLYSQLSSHGPWPLPCLATCSHHAERVCLGIPVQASYHLEWRCACACVGVAVWCLCCSVLCCVLCVVLLSCVVSCRVCCVVVCWIAIVVLLVVCLLRCEKRDVTSMTVPKKNDICNLTQIHIAHVRYFSGDHSSRGERHSAVAITDQVSVRSRSDDISSAFFVKKVCWCNSGIMCVVSWVVFLFCVASLRRFLCHTAIINDTKVLQSLHMVQQIPTLRWSC